MEKTRVILDPAYKIAQVDPRIFGGFLEHMGWAVYEGVYDPQSSHADENAFRQDVLSALRWLRLTAIRYPGGNFASGYHWLGGISGQVCVLAIELVYKTSYSLSSPNLDIVRE
jgi:alpha-L-arabinofuranosidase